jgi:hypothetical protein
VLRCAAGFSLPVTELLTQQHRSQAPSIRFGVATAIAGGPGRLGPPALLLRVLQIAFSIVSGQVTLPPAVQLGVFQ